MRLFVGLAVEEAVKETLERLTLRLRAKDEMMGCGGRRGISGT